MEVCKIKIADSVLWGLVKCEILTTNDYELLTVDEPDYDYSANESWGIAKAKSDKAFRDLKKLEFEIRTNHK